MHKNLSQHFLETHNNVLRDRCSVLNILAVLPFFMFSNVMLQKNLIKSFLILCKFHFFIQIIGK